jgi:thymidylate kinase
VGLERIHTRGLGQDAFESLEALTKSRSIFLGLTDAHVVKFDATQAPEQVHAAIVAELLAREPLKRWVKGAPRGP